MRQRHGREERDLFELFQENADLAARRLFGRVSLEFGHRAGPVLRADVPGRALSAEPTVVSDLLRLRGCSVPDRHAATAVAPGTGGDSLGSQQTPSSSGGKLSRAEFATIR